MVMENVPGLIREVVRGSFRLSEPLLDLLLPPLGFHVMMLAAIAAVPFAFTGIYALCSVALVAFHVVSAISVGGGGLRDFTVLFASPFYVLWKLVMVPGIVRSAGRKAAWVRTER
jgi:hypothetical protein